MARCNCESGHCEHHHGDPEDVWDVQACTNEATGDRMIYVGNVCRQCALRTIASPDGASLIQLGKGEVWSSNISTARSN